MEASNGTSRHAGNKSTLRHRKLSALAMLMISVLAGCNPATESVDPTPKALSVQTQPLVQVDSYHVERQYVGTVKAGQQANLGFELAGKVEALLVDVGDHIEQGQPLVKLDTALLETELSQYQAQKHEVKAQLDLVNANLKRQRSLKSKGFSAEAEIDSLTSQQQVLQANLLRLDATIQANELRKNKSTIIAPYSGIIASRHISLGDVVNVGNPTLTLLAADDKEAFIGIPAYLVGKITANPEQTIKIGRTNYPATLLNSGALVDTQSRTVGLRYLLPQQAPVLDGELAYLLYQDEISETGYWIPLTGLIDGLRGVWNVFIVNRDHQVERRTVEVLFANDQMAFITGAIEPNEQIIASGLHRIVPGQRVNPTLITDSTVTE
ncbi:efflux RND transporter periplasmic adaptor subunit [Vibrio hippocampi]|uniref:Multidrug resistance protein MdtA n=1 Tax=Vibrio hippocampi TaxID=654686 RepID=A0ABM8ZI64_9VIBR|nr:efflux RND transporter periplasmic adaptor subunit [Vibrio hippocampi]CAH0526180.1 Multidrug resistance protein MdtA [Vibrio hippocampi]